MDDDALERIVASMSSLADSTGTINDSLAQLAGVMRVLAERLGSLEERFREHGHIGENTTVGLGSCWDGS